MKEENQEVFKLKKQIDKLKKSIKKQRYGLVWMNVPEAFEDDVENKIPILKEEPSLKIQNSDGKPTHILIEGDNYHALTCLNYTHKGKIDVIYIDPPYNTGSDGFKYKDKRTISTFPDGTKVPKDHPFRHSYWLSFIEKRVELAKSLLSPDGFIAISIDDNEFSQLKLLLDYTFTNNVKTIVIKMSEASGLKMASIKKAGSLPKYKEYLLIAKPAGVRNLHFDQISKEKWDKEYNILLDNFSREDKQVIDEVAKEDSIGLEDIKKVDKIFSNVELKSVSLEMKTLGLKEKEKDKWLFENSWRICRTAAGDSVKKLTEERKKNMKQKLFSVISKRDNILYIVKSDYAETSKRPRVQLLFAEDYLTTHPGDLWTDIKTTGLDSEGEINFKNGKKPIQLLERIIKANKNKDSIVLDFFAGSGSTGHAVLDLNEKDGGRRQFIMVTNNEGNIMEEVCYPRIKNVINGTQKIKKYGNSLKYYKTSFIGKNNILEVSDEDKIELAHNAGGLLAIGENTLEPIKQTGYYQLFKDNIKEKYTAVYFREELDQFDKFIGMVEKLNKEVTIYVFSWSDNEFSEEFDHIKNVRVKTIPIPILEIYKNIYNLVQ